MQEVFSLGPLKGILNELAKDKPPVFFEFYQGLHDGNVFDSALPSFEEENEKKIV